jgi:membrane protein
MVVLGGLYLAAGGGSAWLKAMNRAYRVCERRPWWERYLVGLGLTLMAASVVAVAVLLMVLGQLAAQAANSTGAPDWFWGLAGLARWPLLVLVLMAEAAVMYRVAPDARLPWRWVTPGAALFAAGWLAASVVFVVYVGAAGGYAATYGALGGAIVLLLWLQLTAGALVLGAELNALLEAPPADAAVREAVGRLGGGRSRQEQVVEALGAGARRDGRGPNGQAAEQLGCARAEPGTRQG